MKKIIHYTSEECWDKIREDGVLLPLSNPYLLGEYLPDRSKRIVSRKKEYLVGLPELLPDEWMNSGLLERLIEYTSGEIALNIPILQKKGSFVRECFHISPKRLEELYGDRDLFDQYFSGDARLTRAIKRYLSSSISLARYKGEYKLPEIWLPQITPFNLIEKIK